VAGVLSASPGRPGSGQRRQVWGGGCNRGTLEKEEEKEGLAALMLSGSGLGGATARMKAA
jgi:hypothetical protein